MNLIRIVLIALLLPLLNASAAPAVDEIIANTIARIERDKTLCPKYTNRVVAKSIKYDKKMNPDEITTMTKLAYHVNERISEQIYSIDKDGKQLTPKEIDERAKDQTEKWNDEHKDGKAKKSASRENFVDPLTTAGVGTYSFHLIETRDSVFSVVDAAVAGTKEIVDQSVQRLTTYYVVQARAITEDEKHLNATYWIDAKTYGLLRSEFAPSKMPSFVEMLEFRLDYQIAKNGDSTIYFPQRFELKGKAGFLFFKGRFGVVEEYSDYQCVDVIDESLLSTRYFYRPEEGQGK